MTLLIFKRFIAIICVLMSVLNTTPYTPSMVAAWIVGPEYWRALPEEKAQMMLDLYINQAFIFVSDETEELTRAWIGEMLVGVISAEGDGSKIVEAIEALPVYERSGRDTARDYDYQIDDDGTIRFKQSMRKLIEISALPDDVKNGCYYFTDGINDVVVYFIKTDYENVYEFAGDYINDRGEVCVGYTGVYYDTETTMIYGFNGNGILQIGFDMRADDITMTNPIYPWQRRFGFNVLFDVLGNLVLIKTDTVRVKFNYNGKDKMIQFWKGNYTRISNGAEIGLYNKREGSSWLYDCVSDEEMMYMSMKLYHGDDLVLHNDRQLHWWLTGYRAGPTFDPDELRLDCTIEFPEQGLFDAFMSAAPDAFGKSAEITSDGLAVHIVWQ